MPIVITPGKGRPAVGQYECTGEGNGKYGCGAKLEVYIDDLYHTSNSCYDGSVDYFTTFCCPVCSAETDIKFAGSPRKLPYKTEHELYVIKQQVFAKLQKECGDQKENWIKVLKYLITMYDGLSP